MDFVQRLILLFVFLLPSLMPGTALANYNKTFTRYKLVIYNTYHQSTTDACNYFLTVKEAAYPTENMSIVGCTEVQVSVKSGASTYYNSAITKYGSCNGVESEWGTGICTGSCVAPQVLQPNGTCAAPQPPSCTYPELLQPDGTCKNPCYSKKGQSTSYGSTSPVSGDVCVSSCVVRMDEGECFGATPAMRCYYEGRFTGDPCQGSPGGSPSSPTPPPPEPTVDDCVKQGKTWGTVSGGTVVCVSKGTAGGTPSTTTGTPSSSSTTQGGTNVDGSTKPSTSGSSSSTTSQTYNSDGSVTSNTQSTTTNPDGSTTTSNESKTESMADFCKDNPTVNACVQRDQGTFSGSCDTGFTCEGDAAQCAIARETHRRNCELYKDDSVLTSKFNEAKNDNGSTNPSATANVQAVHVPTSLDATSPFGGQCNQDVTINVAGSSVTIPFSAWCDVLNALGYLFLACAYISAAYILGSAV